MKKCCLSVWILIAAIGALLSDCGVDAVPGSAKASGYMSESVEVPECDMVFSQDLFAMDTYMELHA